MDGVELRNEYLNHILGKLHTPPIFSNLIQGQLNRRWNEDWTDLFIPLTTTSPNKSLRDPKELRPTREYPPISVLEIIREEPYLVLCGSAGAGKSTVLHTFLLYLAGECLNDRDINLARLYRKDSSNLDDLEYPFYGHPLLPMHINLRELASREAELHIAGEFSLLQACNGYLTNIGMEALIPAFQRELQDTGIQFLLDELEGLAIDDFDSFSRLLREMPEFIYRFPKSRILLAAKGTRVEWEQRRDLSDFTLTEISPLNKSQSSLFIERWFEYCADKLELDVAVSLRRQQIIQKWIEGENRNLPIIGNPLMLTLWVYILIFAGDFKPGSREELIERAIEVLISRWITDGLNLSSSDPVALTTIVRAKHESYRVELQRILGRLVYQKVLQTSSNLTLQKFSFDEVMNEVSSIDFGIDRVDDPLRENHEIGGGILVSDQKGNYTLLHEIFQESLIADYLVIEDDSPNLISLFLSNPQRWQEVFVMCTKKIAKKDLGAIWRLLDTLYQRGSSTIAEPWVGFVAGKILGELGLMHEECPMRILSRTQTSLLQILEKNGFPAKERTLAGILLDKLGDPRFIPDAWFLSSDPLLGFIEIPAGNFIMGTPETDISSLIDEFGIGSDWIGQTLGAMLSQEPNIDALINEMGLKEGWQELDSSELLIQWYRREIPQHELFLPTFYLARCPVTIGQFRAFVEASGCGPEIPKGLEGVRNHPIAHVTWSDSMRYCDWLTQILISWEGTPDIIRSLLQNGWRITLPSEAEWEKAARGSGNNRTYPWGDQFDSNCANLKETNLGETSTVGCFPEGASPYGLLDMAGNVWEWTRSLWGEDEYIIRYPYPYDPLDGREDTMPGNELCVLRGASYNNYRRYARCATRRSPLPVLRTSIRGFRIALSPVERRQTS